jgi:hypothetical protein
VCEILSKSLLDLLAGGTNVVVCYISMSFVTIVIQLLLTQFSLLRGFLGEFMTMTILPVPGRLGKIGLMCLRYLRSMVGVNDGGQTGFFERNKPRYEDVDANSIYIGEHACTEYFLSRHHIIRCLWLGRGCQIDVSRGL